MNRHFFEILKTVVTGYPYDSTFLLNIEKAKIKEMIFHFERVNAGERFGSAYVGIENDIKYMKIAVRLLDIITSDDSNIFHFNNKISFDSNEKGNVIGSWVDKDGNRAENGGYQCDVNVNLRNMDRFVKDSALKDFYVKFPHELYMIKVRHLYHKIRFEQESKWWE